STQRPSNRHRRRRRDDRPGAQGPEDRPRPNLRCRRRSQGSSRITRAYATIASFFIRMWVSDADQQFFAGEIMKWMRYNVWTLVAISMAGCVSSGAYRRQLDLTAACDSDKARCLGDKQML